MSKDFISLGQKGCLLNINQIQDITLNNGKASVKCLNGEVFTLPERLVKNALERR